MVDLGCVRGIHEIIIYNRLDASCGGRARKLRVLISDDGEGWGVLYVHDGTSFGGVDGFPLRIPCGGNQARFVRIKLAEVQYLHLDEIEVYSLAAE